ncbi:mitochondrial protein Pet127-domain-containing protein [Blyttiomyces helicus]|uniref:Mitochondrial protein Pet127-domain-containing protein n=1 Tax=Blyttiomyces helicus TaxID=388810 RepID=A0A4P9WAY1_9FUNG|nr:mitochondrial protein Pet127-domain-containing protein [Blyttiomyces helicus]|eukprot:RKO89771.1 mitochondrial protein Pet127-domain-containing protein [Blyttiomyces helicus]
MFSKSAQLKLAPIAIAAVRASSRSLAASASTRCFSSSPVAARRPKKKNATEDIAAAPPPARVAQNAGAKENAVTPPEQPPIARLAHGLEKVVERPGIHLLQNAETKDFNFSPFLARIPPPEEFDFDALPPYMTSSRDPTLLGIARKQGRRYVASTSTLTPLLTKAYFSLSMHKNMNVDGFSPAFKHEPSRYTLSNFSPVAVILRSRDGIYAIDNDKGEEGAGTILMHLGKSMEKMLTVDEAEFNTFLKANSRPEMKREKAEAFHYAKVEDFLLRAQLDCTDGKNKTFDLKTRGTLAVRMSPLDYMENIGYKVKHLTGLLESYEREYYDMLRGTMIKYWYARIIGGGWAEITFVL